MQTPSTICQLRFVMSGLGDGAMINLVVVVAGKTGSSMLLGYAHCCYFFAFRPEIKCHKRRSTTARYERCSKGKIPTVSLMPIVVIELTKLGCERENALDLPQLRPDDLQ